jgi:hypothetical protein
LFGDEAAEALSISLKKSRSLVRLYLHNRRGDKNSSICGPKGWTALASAAEAIPSLTEADLGRNYLDAQVLKLNLDERGTPQQTTAQDACVPHQGGCSQSPKQLAGGREREVWIHAINELIDHSHVFEKTRKIDTNSVKPLCSYGA